MMRGDSFSGLSLESYRVSVTLIKRPMLLKLSGFYKLGVNFDGVPFMLTLCCEPVLVPRTDRRVLRSPATSSAFSVLSDLTVQMLIHCICGGPLPLLAVCSPGTAAAYAYIVHTRV